MTMRRITTTAAATLAASAWPLATALAHSGHASGWSAGLMHPVTGADHVTRHARCRTVGSHARRRGAVAVACRLCCMHARRFASAHMNIAIPMLEPMIASSVILLVPPSHCGSAHRFRRGSRYCDRGCGPWLRPRVERRVKPCPSQPVSPSAQRCCMPPASVPGLPCSGSPMRGSPAQPAQPSPSLAWRCWPPEATGGAHP